MTSSKTNSTNIINPEDGYDLPLYGMENGTFYSFHISAISCIAVSLVCVSTSLLLSFRTHHSSSFFKKWSKSDRFVVYLAICDGLFNLSHITDHLHIVVAKEMVRPRWLCELYGFNLTVFVTAQVLMVNVIAVNIFLLIFFGKKVNFGRRDWRLLSWTFGVPAIGASIAAGFRQLGPNGAYCNFDGVKGKVLHLMFTTVAMLVVLIVNAFFYILTLYQIHRQTRDIEASGIHTSHHHTHNAAKSMSLFVVAFMIQWWSVAVYGVWKVFEPDVPQAFVQLVVTFSNIGGVLNLIVFLILRRRKLFARTNTTIDSHQTSPNFNRGRY